MHYKGLWSLFVFVMTLTCPVALLKRFIQWVSRRIKAFGEDAAKDAKRHTSWSPRLAGADERWQKHGLTGSVSLSLQSSHGDGVHGHQEREFDEDGCCRDMDGGFCDGVDGETLTRTCLKSTWNDTQNLFYFRNWFYPSGMTWTFWMRMVEQLDGENVIFWWKI